MTNVVECEHDALTVGMALEADFRPHTDDLTVPVFRPPSSNP
jgi:hypothetical protein